MLLSEIAPTIVQELTQGLFGIREEALAARVERLEIFGRCACGQRDCATFYTRPRAEWIGKQLRQVIPEVRGLIALDVLGHEIVCIEFLGRADVIAALNEHVGRVAER